MSDTFENGKLYDGAADTDVQDMTGVSIDWIQRQAADRMRKIRDYEQRVVADLLQHWAEQMKLKSVSNEKVVERKTL